MKNPFKRFGRKKSTSKVNIPWKDQKGGGEENLKKTMVGQRPQDLSCSQCEYPLIASPSQASPCPNCGFAGNQQEPVNYDSGKTMDLNQINMGPSSSRTNQYHAPAATSFRFKLIVEPSGEDILIEGDENEVILNREYLDPGNSSISSEQHILIRLASQQFWLSDLSSNGSTFIQAKSRTLLQDGCRVVLGNKLLKFAGGGSGNMPVDDGKTKMFGQFNMAPQFSSGQLTLIDEMTHQTYSFQERQVSIKRDDIEPGNHSISSRQHALFEFEGGNWFLTDQSSNGATFVQVMRDTPLQNRQKMLLGNRIFRFEY
ncbi:MAG: FHA domain-containing protein, partial [Candidatus Cyclobacteriaceae bacterium M3_2C_046]